MAARRVVSECNQDEKKNRVPSTEVFRRANSGSASLNARISVGHTNVKSLEGLIKSETVAREELWGTRTEGRTSGSPCEPSQKKREM